MKKFLSLILITAFFAGNAQAADQWTKASPIGTESSGTIDDVMRINQAAQDRLLNGYKRGLGVNYATANTLTVLPGEIAIPNAAVSTVKYRETTADTTITWADIDTGAEATSTTYYLYTTADTDITGMVFKISTSSSLPSGSTYYRAIATFYNNSSGNIENVISYPQDHGTDYPWDAKGYITFTGSTAAILSSYNVSSTTDNAAGDTTVAWETDFGSADYPVQVTAEEGLGFVQSDTAQTAGAVRVATTDIDAPASCCFDKTKVHVVAFGRRT